MSRDEEKAARLAAALRANLGRRKAQGRARREEASGAAGEGQGGTPPSANTGAPLENTREGGNAAAPGDGEIVPAEKAR